jgi:hypothetical protein
MIISSTRLWTSWEIHKFSHTHLEVKVSPRLWDEVNVRINQVCKCVACPMHVVLELNMEHGRRRGHVSAKTNSSEKGRSWFWRFYFGDWQRKQTTLPLIDRSVFGAMLFCLRLILARANNPHMTIWLNIYQLQTFYLLNLIIQLN